MSSLRAETVLKNSLEILLNGSEENSEKFGPVLQELSLLIQDTNRDVELLNELTKDQLVWRRINDIFITNIDNDSFIESKIRLVRGFIILSRNLITNTNGVQHFLDLNIIYSMFELNNKINNFNISDELKINFYTSFFQFLNNFSNNIDNQDFIELNIIELNKFSALSINWNQDLLLPFFKYLDNLTNINEFLYIGLSKGQNKLIFNLLLIGFEKINLDNELSSFELIIIKIFNKIIVHESFLKFMTVFNDETDMIRYYKVSEAIITSKSNWEVFELTVILSWNFELLEKTIDEIEHYFKINENEEPIFIYEKISRNLDIFTSLVKFEHSLKFFNSYNGINKLVKLLGILNQYIKPKRLKDSEKIEKKEGIIEYKSFPHTKSMIIEILSSLIYNSFENQEKMREIHGLELILSNCIIDDNEPFIKERSIVCLRFLLLNNYKNQEFVSKLEAKQSVPNETLDEAGFEVEIVDGKVKLKQKVKLEEV